MSFAGLRGTNSPTDLVRGTIVPGPLCVMAMFCGWYERSLLETAMSMGSVSA